MKLERKIRFIPAWDERLGKGKQPDKNYGVHNAEILFMVRDPDAKGAVVLILNTGWDLPGVRERRGYHSLAFAPLGELSVHSSFQGEDQGTKCEWLNGKECWIPYSSALPAMALHELLIAEGDEALWLKLEAMWHEYLGALVKEE